jgi:hypothetical protein
MATADIDRVLFWDVCIEFLSKFPGKIKKSPQAAKAGGFSTKKSHF